MFQAELLDTREMCREQDTVNAQLRTSIDATASEIGTVEEECLNLGHLHEERQAEIQDDDARHLQHLASVEDDIRSKKVSDGSRPASSSLTALQTAAAEAQSSADLMSSEIDDVRSKVDAVVAANEAVLLQTSDLRADFTTRQLQEQTAQDVHRREVDERKHEIGIAKVRIYQLVCSSTDVVDRIRWRLRRIVFASSQTRSSASSWSWTHIARQLWKPKLRSMPP